MITLKKVITELERPDALFEIYGTERKVGVSGVWKSDNFHARVLDINLRGAPYLFPNDQVKNMFFEKDTCLSQKQVFTDKTFFVPSLHIVFLKLYIEGRIRYTKTFRLFEGISIESKEIIEFVNEHKRLQENNKSITTVDDGVRVYSHG